MQQEVLDHLAEEEAVLTGSHFIYTSGLHGSAYINMRTVAHQASWLKLVSVEMASYLRGLGIEVVLGPETLGRTLACYVAASHGVDGVWCDIVEDGGGKYANFSPKLNFGRLIKGKRVAIVDDLLTTGSSIKMASDLVIANGANPVIAVAVVRRTPDVTAEQCGVQRLKVVADVPGFTTYTSEECAAQGPCSELVPVVLRPGHGHEWIKDHPDYPTA
jgi:orotate phosphoribosyltransferase